MKKIFLFIMILLIPAVVYAANLLDQTEDTAPTADDMMYCVDNPAGGGTDKKCTVGNVAKGMTSTNLIDTANILYETELDTFSELDTQIADQTLVHSGSNIATATALAANGANCSAGNYPLGIDASGAVESCTPDDILTEEEVEDFVGGMVTGNTETLITVTYQDADGTIDFVVDNDLNNYDNTTSAFLNNVVEDTTPTLGGTLDANGNDIQNVADILFQTGATGGTISTGTSNADKFILEGYDVDDGVYRNILEIDAGNTVTYEFNEDGHAIDFRVESDTDTHALFVDGSANNVGIGSSAPVAKLHVNGSAISKTLRVTGLDCTGNANGGAVTADASGNLSCTDDDNSGGGGNWTDSGSNVYITGGNVGIGTSAITAMLEIEENGTTPFMISNGTGNGDFLIVTTAGNVGMGSTAPDAKLVVGGNIKSSGTGQASFNEGMVINNAGGGDADDDFRAETNNVSNAFEVDASADIVRINAMFSYGSQTVGIGTTTPTVSGQSFYISSSSTLTVSDFVGSNIESGVVLVIESDGTITFDVTSSGLKCGTTDLVTSDGDVSTWIYNGVDWLCISFTDMSDDLS